MCVSILTITTQVSAKNTMAKLTSGFFITILAFAILGSLIYLSYFANDRTLHTFAASENSTSNETSTNNNVTNDNANANSTGNLTALIPSNFSTQPMNNTNATATTITVPSNSSFSTQPMNNTNATATTTSTAASNSNVTLLYEYPDLGLKIKYPPSWEAVQYGRAIKAYGEGVIANLLSPLESTADKFRDYVILKIENLTSPDLSRTPANNSIGGNPTYQVVIERPNLANKSDIVKIVREWTPLNGKAFVVELDAEKSRYAHYFPLAMEMINSIELNGVGSSPTVTSTNQSTPSMSSQQQPTSTLSPNQATISTENNTKTSAIIGNLLKRDIDKNETNFESQP